MLSTTSSSRTTMPPARRRVSYVIPPPTDPVPRLQLPPHGLSRHGAIGPHLIFPPPSDHEHDRPPQVDAAAHPRHRLGVAALALDTTSQLVGRAAPEGILYSGGRDGLVIGWDLGIPMKRRAARYGVAGGSTRRWEIMTNWSDDVIEEEGDEDEFRSDGDVLGEVTGKTRRRFAGIEHEIPHEEQWETDVAATEARRDAPPSQFRQSAQLHSDWVNDILLCNQNQTLVSASSDGTVRAWNPHAHSHAGSVQEPTTIGTHGDYVRCLTHWWVASGSFDRTIKLWDLNAVGSSTAPLTTLHAPDASGAKASVYALATDPYGHIVVSGSPERVIRMWDPRTGKRTAKLVGHTDNIRAMLLSEDAKYLLTGSADASIKLWSLSSQRCLHTFTHHTDSVWSLFSTHPTLEIFYSGDRSGLVCKVDVEGCSDISEGECIVLCQDTADSERPRPLDGINKIVALDDHLLWTATGNSSIKRWKVPARKAVRAAALNEGKDVESPPATGSFSVDYTPEQLAWSGKRSSFDFSTNRAATTPPRSVSYDLQPPVQRSMSPRRSPRASVAPSILSSASLAVDVDPEREGEETWYGIPFDSLVRLMSPNEALGGPAPLMRGRDPEIATLYSAASVISMPRLNRVSIQPVHPSRTLQATHDTRGTSPFRSDALASHPETQTLHAPARMRGAYEEREVAADAEPLHREPDEVILGEHGLVRCATLNDRVHVLTVDTAGEVAVWDIVRCMCLGRYPSTDVAAASFCGSEASERSEGHERERSPREALETVRERIEGEAVVNSWSTVDTKTGVLTVHLNERCFEAEIYADEAGFGPERRFGDETRINIGKWVLRNLFTGFIREEQRIISRRMRESHDHSQHRLQRGTAPTHIDLNSSPPQSGDSQERRRTSSDASWQSSTVSVSPPHRSATIIVSPNMLPAIPSTSSIVPRSSPLLTQYIPINGTIRESSVLTPIPQSPAETSTPMPIPLRTPQRSQTADAATSVTASVSPSDYFSVRTRRGSTSAGSVTTPDDFSSFGKAGTDTGLSPITPSGLMGRLKAFGKSNKRQASELSTQGGTLTSNEVPSTPGDALTTTSTAPKPAVQILMSASFNPPSSQEAPSLPIPLHTGIIIAEEATSGWTTLYRGQVSSTGADVHILEDSMPIWLLEYLLINRTPPVTLNKISFVLLPFPAKDPRDQLPELLNTAQSKLTASRFLRVRKLTYHVQDKLERMAGSSVTTPASGNSPRSSFDGRSRSPAALRAEGESRPRAEDMYEIVCNDVVLPLDMTLAAVRQFVWRQGAELSMYYRRRMAVSHPQ